MGMTPTPKETGGEYITDDAGDAYQISAERAMDRWGVLAWPPKAGGGKCPHDSEGPPGRRWICD